jgi:calcium/calmodulin-dependent protein kinase-4
LLFSSKDINSTIKVSDFGLAKILDQETMDTFCGSPNFLAPEIIEGKGYDKKVDCWAIGIIIYIMLCGFSPFEAEDFTELTQNIVKAKIEFPSPSWDVISGLGKIKKICKNFLAKDLIVRLLAKDPKERLSPEEILEHRWISGEQTPRKELKQLTFKIQEYNSELIKRRDKVTQ